MSTVKIPNYVVINGRGFWKAKPKMKALGIESTPCGPDGPEAWAKALKRQEAWTRARKGLPDKLPADPSEDALRWPAGSVGEGFKRFRRIGQENSTWARKEIRTREDWWRGWRYIKPIFGDLDPASVTFDDLDGWYGEVLKKYGVNEAFRAMKIWRALWRALAALGYCERDSDPSLAIRRVTPEGRSQVWVEGEVVRLVKGAIQRKFYGLACCIAIAWDTGFSPVDTRLLSSAAMTTIDGRTAFTGVNREKTDKAVIGTLSRRTERLVLAYIASLGAEPLPNAPLFRTRRGPSYKKDKLGRDFRRLREALFGEDDDRTIMDLRRSGAVEMSDGGVDMTHMAAKMGNTVNSSQRLQRTYMPVSKAAVKGADAARLVGRRRTREGSK